MGFDQQIQDVEQQHVYTYNLIYIYIDFPNKKLF